MTQKHKVPGTDRSLNMEPDTLSPHSSVISTVSFHYLCACGVRVTVCVPVCVCSCVRMRQQQSIEINLDPQLFEPPPDYLPPMTPSVWVFVPLLPCYCSVGGSLWSLCVVRHGQDNNRAIAWLVALKREPVNMDLIKLQ